MLSKKYPSRQTRQFLVSILVVVEDALEALITSIDRMKLSVSILVLMEDALEDKAHKKSEYFFGVSILVVVEDALEDFDNFRIEVQQLFQSLLLWKMLGKL